MFDEFQKDKKGVEDKIHRTPKPGYEGCWNDGVEANGNKLSICNSEFARDIDPGRKPYTEFAGTIYVIPK